MSLTPNEKIALLTSVVEEMCDEVKFLASSCHGFTCGSMASLKARLAPLKEPTGPEVVSGCSALHEGLAQRDARASLALDRHPDSATHDGVIDTWACACGNGRGRFDRMQQVAPRCRACGEPMERVQ